MKLFKNSAVFQMRVIFCQIKAARKQLARLSVEHPTLPWHKLAFRWKVKARIKQLLCMYFCYGDKLNFLFGHSIRSPTKPSEKNNL